MLFSLREKQPNLFPAFGADDDSRLIGEANNNLLRYQLKANQSQNEYFSINSGPFAYCSWWQWLARPEVCIINDAISNNLNNTFINTQRARALERRDAWTKGANWWLNANNRFKAAVGAAEVVGTSTTAYECNCTTYDPITGNDVFTTFGTTSTPQDCYNQSTNNTSCNLGTPTTVVSFSFVDVPSDGIVLASSASGYPGAATKEMIGSNHQQMRNDTNTKDRLNELYNGDHGIYFKSRQ